MAHWAELDDNNTVLRVTVGSNDDPDEGYQWLIDNLGGRWVQTSYNGNFRVRYAGIGYIYDETLDAFLPPKPYPSWVIDPETVNWAAPVAKPEGEHQWAEQTQQWVAKPDGGLWLWDPEVEEWVEPDVVN